MLTAMQAVTMADSIDPRLIRFQVVAATASSSSAFRRADISPTRRSFHPLARCITLRHLHAPDVTLFRAYQTAGMMASPPG
jgi:hypothetical protein